MLGAYVPVLIVLKWTPALNNILHLVSRTGGPEKIKSKIHPGYYLQGLRVLFGMLLVLLVKNHELLISTPFKKNSCFIL